MSKIYDWIFCSAEPSRADKMIEDQRVQRNRQITQNLSSLEQRVLSLKKNNEELTAQLQELVVKCEGALGND